MSKQAVTEEFLFAWQDQMLATAKNILLAEGHLRPYVRMLTYPEMLPTKFDGQLIPLEPTFRATDSELAMCVLPLSYSARELCDIIVRHVFNDEARARYAAVEAVFRAHPPCDEDTFYGAFVKAALEPHGWVEADLVAIRIKETLKQIQPLAYVKQDDAWCVVMNEGETRGSYKQSLTEDSRAQECIISTLEHWGGMRFISQPYQRHGDQRGKGKVKSFGDPIIRTQPRTGTSDARHSGRFTWMLPMKAEGRVQ